jgi:hypothetical protein
MNKIEKEIIMQFMNVDANHKIRMDFILKKTPAGFELPHRSFDYYLALTSCLTGCNLDLISKINRLRLREIICNNGDMLEGQFFSYFFYCTIPISYMPLTA